MITLSLTIDRTQLELDPLVITNDPHNPAVPFHLPEDGITRPQPQFRVVYAPDSSFYPGDLALGAVLDGMVLSLRIYARGADAADLKANKAVLEAALAQWAYEVTVDENGATYSYRADPCLPAWGEVNSGMVRSNLAACTVQMPANLLET